MKFGTRYVSALLTLSMVFVFTPSASATFAGKNGRIAFIFGPDVYTMNPDGSDVKQLTNLGPDNFAFWEFWSADGKQIVFTEFIEPDFNGQLWIMNSDGTNQHLLLAESGFDESRPSFSPDGGSIVFTRCKPPLELEQCALYQIAVDGKGLKAITKYRVSVQDRYAMYSPNGKKIVFLSLSRDGISGALHEVNADGTGKLRQITPTVIGGARPNWSPDGGKIVFRDNCCSRGHFGLWLMNSHGSVLHQRTKHGYKGPYDDNPSWSPEGDSIVFERDAPDFSTSAIFLIKPDGSGLSQKLVLPGATSKLPETAHLHRQALSKVALKNRLKKIEDGGALPRWGAAPN